MKNGKAYRVTQTLVYRDVMNQRRRASQSLSTHYLYIHRYYIPV